MTVFPVIVRELRAESRHAFNYWLRVLGADRKSTRLNSSHLVISYAVFCLKKKKHSTVVRGVEEPRRYRVSVVARRRRRRARPRADRRPPPRRRPFRLVSSSLCRDPQPLVP